MGCWGHQYYQMLLDGGQVSVITQKEKVVEKAKTTDHQHLLPKHHHLRDLWEQIQNAHYVCTPLDYTRWSPDSDANIFIMKHVGTILLSTAYKRTLSVTAQTVEDLEKYRALTGN